MTQPTAFTTSSATASDCVGPARAPSRVLQEVILKLLTPMFRPTCNGDATLARFAAQEALDAHNPRTAPELIAVAQVIAFAQADLATAKARSLG